MTTKTHEIKLDGYGAHTTLAEDRPIMLLGTAESYGIETLHVVSGESWDGLTVTATFNAPDGTSTDMLMDADGNITVPSEATAKSGSGRIVFTGVSNGIQRISCDLDYFVVAHSAINGVQSGGTAPSWFEQAVTRFMPAGGTAGQVLTKKTDADFEAEWQDSQGGAGLEPLIGTTQTITASQVLAAIKEGRDIALQYEDSYHGTFVFSAFNANEKLGIVVSNSIIPQMNGLTGTLIGFVEDDGWLFKATNTATKDDVGTAVNEALTAAKASGEFDGADGKSAYSYAQDGGYTGTEAEFAAKLAAESIDKALFVVNITQNSDGTLSADKTFDEIAQAYNEGKYSIVAVCDGLIMPLSEITGGSDVLFSIAYWDTVYEIIITSDTEVQKEMIPLATTDSKLPNPYSLTFTGAVSETYDGSSAKTITIPSGGGGAASGLGIYDNYDVTLISFALIAHDTLPIEAGIEITTDDNGNPFSYDGIVVWSDIKSGISYTDIKFNGIRNFYFPFTHGVKTSMSVYITDGQSMRAISGGGSNVYIKQTRADVNGAFYPAEVIADIPEKLTSVHLCPRNKVASGTFYKIWGLTKK